MANKPKPTPWRVTGPNGDVVIWASDTTALKTFFPTATKLFGTSASWKAVSYKGGSYRQYPGDSTPVSRTGGSRQIFPERWLSNNTTPGTVFWCETFSTDVLGKKTKKRKQFTYQGSFGDLKDIARDGTRADDWIIRNGTGAGYEVTGTAPVPPAVTEAPEVV
jgi:hypothetical protein